MTNSESNAPVKPTGMRCMFTGTIISQPQINSIKGGTSQVMSATIVYENYDSSTDICRINIFPGANKPIPDLQLGDQIEITGTLKLNSWEKDGVKKTGLNVTAKSSDVRKIL